MALRFTFSPVMTPEEIVREANLRAEILERRSKIREIQNKVLSDVNRVLKMWGHEQINGAESLFRGLRTPEMVTPSPEKEGLLEWTDKEHRKLTINPQELETLILLQQLADAFSHYEKFKKNCEEKRASAESARNRLSKIASALKNKELQVELDDLTPEKFEEKLNEQAPQEDRETWETILRKIWQQHEQEIPDYQQRRQMQKHLPTREEMEQLIKIDTETREQLVKLCKRLSEKPGAYLDTLGDLSFLLKKIHGELSHKFERFALSAGKPGLEWQELQAYLNETMEYEHEKLPEESEEPEDMEKYNTRAKVTTLLMLLGVVTAFAIPKLQQNQNATVTPSPVATANSSNAMPRARHQTNLLYPDMGVPISGDPEKTFQSASPQNQPLIESFNQLRRSGLRKITEWYPLIERNGSRQRFILFYPGPEGVIPSAEEGGIEAFLKIHQQLIRPQPQNVRISSITVTDGTKKPDQSEVLFDLCFEVSIQGKNFLILQDERAYSAVPENRIIAPFKMFQIQEDGKMLLPFAEIQHHEHMNPHLKKMVWLDHPTRIEVPFQTEGSDSLSSATEAFLTLYFGRK